MERNEQQGKCYLFNIQSNLQALLSKDQVVVKHDSSVKLRLRPHNGKAGRVLPSQADGYDRCMHPLLLCLQSSFLTYSSAAGKRLSLMEICRPDRKEC